MVILATLLGPLWGGVPQRPTLQVTAVPQLSLANLFYQLEELFSWTAGIDPFIMALFL